MAEGALPAGDAALLPGAAAQRQAAARTPGLPQDRAVFLLASTGHARKGLDLLVQMPSVTRTFRCCSSSPAAQRDARAEPSDLGYRTDMPDVYRAVDCTVMASRFEPFGLVGVESVLCGTPLVGAAAWGAWKRSPRPRPFRSTSTRRGAAGGHRHGIANGGGGQPARRRPAPARWATTRRPRPMSTS